MVRIAAGALRGRTIPVPRGVRATESLVRQALFNILGDRVVDARVLDAFAGSGALGLEALSRGAAHVTFIEQHRFSVRVLRQTLDELPGDCVAGDWRLLATDALASLRKLADAGETFDLILFDPPYAQEVAEKALRLVGACVILARTGVVCVEHVQSQSVPATSGALAMTKQHRYGQTVLSFYEPAARSSIAEQRPRIR